jgi:hypothetical protein
VNEAEIRIAQKLLPREWTLLRDVVVGVGALFGRDLDLVMINRYLREGLLELMLVRPDGTMMWFSKEDCEHRTVDAPFNRAEGVYVEPPEAGRYLARLAELTSPVERVEPGRDVDAAGVPVQGTQVKPGGPQFPPAAPKHTIAGRKKAAQEKIAEAVKKIWPPDGIVPLDLGPADLMHAVEDLYKREAVAKGPKEKPRKPPSWSSCKRFLEDQRST